MAQLFPPIVNGTIPAFYSNGTVSNITVPFSMNRAVNKNQVSGIAVKIKTLQSSISDLIICNGLYNLEGSPYVSISVSDEQYKFKPGQFYKLQIAYISGNEIGYYSNVIIGKCTNIPSITINGLDANKINDNIQNYFGYYYNEDKTESVYSYCFNLFDEEDNIILTSGENIHNGDQDENLNSSVDNFNISLDFENHIYYLQYSVKTINGLELLTEKYPLQKSISIASDIFGSKLYAVSDLEESLNGLVRIYLEDGRVNQAVNVNGNFILYRSDNSSNYQDWKECYKFSINGKQITNNNLWEDRTVENGKSYKYAISQFNNSGKMSEKIISNYNAIDKTSSPVSVSFDDAFLGDKNKQLKIKFNPKISSFKKTVMETKIDTIGSKYPFILRNGQVSYREFPISGLISYLMDTENYFIEDNYTINNLYRRKTKSNENIPKTFPTDLINENIIKEQKFRQDVLDWLTDGEPKLFRSPTEGNILVRLLNVSLTPLEQLGRMLYTFNCTAYEIAECNYENLKNYGIYNLDSLHTRKEIWWNTIDLSKDNNNEINLQNLHTIRLFDMTPGDQLTLTVNDIPLKIEIGQTGQYILEEDGLSISLIIPPQQFKKGYISYSSTQYLENDFSIYSSVEVYQIPSHFFVGEHNIIKEIFYIYPGDESKEQLNQKLDFISIPRIKLTKRKVEPIIQRGNDYYSKDEDGEHKITNFNEATLYQILGYTNKNQYEILGYNSFVQKLNSNNEWEWVKLKENNDSNCDFSVQLGNSIISLETNYDYLYKENAMSLLYSESEDAIKNYILKSGNGVTVELSYILQSNGYLIEDYKLYDIFNKKMEYKNKKAELMNIINASTLIVDEKSEEAKNERNLKNQAIFKARQSVVNSYYSYIETLVKEQERERFMTGAVSEHEKLY